MAPYSFTDKNRALSIARRKREMVETALICDNCYAAGTCSHFQSNRVCALRKDLKPFRGTSPAECVQKLKEIIADLEERAWMNRYFEKLDGGLAWKIVSNQMDSLIRHHGLLAKLYAEMP